MGNFVVSIAASFVGSALLLILAAIFSKKARWVMVGILSRFLDVDIDYVFRDKKDSENDMRHEISRAHWICFFAGRGNELQRDTFATVFSKQPSDRLTSVRILLPHTSVPDGTHDWLRQRETELATFDPAYGQGLLVTQVESNVRFLETHIKSPIIHLRRYNYPNIGRIVLTDRCLFYTPYMKDSHGRHNRVFKFKAPCEMYENMLRLFEQLWSVNQNVVKAMLQRGG